MRRLLGSCWVCEYEEAKSKHDKIVATTQNEDWRRRIGIIEDGSDGKPREAKVAPGGRFGARYLGLTRKSRRSNLKLCGENQKVTEVTRREVTRRLAATIAAKRFERIACSGNISRYND